MQDIRDVLINDSHQLRVLCRLPQICKWAWYKPVKMAKGEDLTESDRQSVKYGLTPTVNASALAVLRQDITHADIDAEFAAAKNDATEWIYTRPDSYYREGDFIENPHPGAGRGGGGAFTNCGYKHDTQPPLVFGDNWEIGIASLKNVANNIVVETYGGSSATWYADPYTNIGAGPIGSGNAQKGQYCYEGLRYDDFAARFGTSSEMNINMNDSYVIPINFIFNRDITQEDWRLGLIVKVPGISGSMVIPDTVVGFFTSRYPLSSIGQTIAQSVQQFSVDMCTNQDLAYKMAAYVDSQGTTDFECIPVFMMMTAPTIYGGGVYARTYQLLNGANATFYSLPLGANPFTLTVKDSETPTPSGDESKTTGNWTLRMLFTGQYTGNASTPSSQRYPINNLVIIWTGSGTPTAGTTYNFAVDFDWQSYDGSNHNGVYQNDNMPYIGNNTITINGTTYYGINIMGSPNITMTTIRKLEVS